MCVCVCVRERERERVCSISGRDETYRNVDVSLGSPGIFLLRGYTAKERRGERVMEWSGGGMERGIEWRVRVEGR
jgi:hypothetical protein